MKIKIVYIALAAVAFAFAGNPVFANPEPKPQPSVAEKSTLTKLQLLAQQRKSSTNKPDKAQKKTDGIAIPAYQDYMR